MAETKTKHVVSVVIDRDLWGRAKAVAKSQEVTTSRFVREAVREALRRSDRAARKSP